MLGTATMMLSVAMAVVDPVSLLTKISNVRLVNASPKLEMIWAIINNLKFRFRSGGSELEFGMLTLAMFIKLKQ